MKMAEKSNEKKLEELYKHFQSDKFKKDLAKCIETKGGKGMEYVPWSNILDRVMQACPTMTYEFHTYFTRMIQDGSLQAETSRPFMGDRNVGWFVQTSVTCYGVKRSMMSPVYGKNHTQVSLKPQANQVHNAMMRCLCKNFAMFGCGLELWTREEVAQLEAEEQTPADTGMETPDAVVNTALEEFGGKYVELRACKKCDTPMTLKSGKFGSFYACPKYPDCKYTEPVQ